ncbi:heavy metal translocating P-type ATPase [Clostridium sp. CAG:354]|jgi:Cu+-exporting ATPase|nr:copper-translocating P-type ATPase [Clostridium sp.]MEE0268732.1 heavy metal translocating P-type ATPase [Clostridia bacterium]CDE10797.1 heavy metal translocating P-type ATPase [Clostridium sp. CAG:354]
MKKVVLNIEGMTCSACSNGLEKYLNKQEGVISASVNLVMATALIEYEDNLSIKDLNRFVKEAGFKSLGEKKEEKKSNELTKLIIFSILGIILMYISMGQMINLPTPKILNMMESPRVYAITLMILSLLFIFYGFDIIKNGIKNIVHKMPNMDSLVGVGVIVNFVYSLWNTIQVFMGNTSLVHHLYFESSAIIILFVKIGRYIDKKNKDKAVDTIKNLVTITPKNGTILKDGKELQVTINEIQKGDTIISKPGEKIAVDGTIINGKTHTDESFITGESKPVSKKVGDTVIAGSINYDGYIEYRAEKIGRDSSISNIVKMVVEATNTKAPIARIADKISGYFVPAIFIIALISFILNFIITKDINESILALVSVLVVACPCALGLATPLAMVVAIGNCSRRGILVKSSETLEAINKVDTIVFDKTGTLTTGKMSIADGVYNEVTLKILKSLEKNSNHPLAKSIYNNERDIFEVQDFEEVPGLGVKGIINGKQYYAGNYKYVEKMNVENKLRDNEAIFASKGESIVYLFDEKETILIIGLADTIKKDITDTIKKLEKLDKKIIMLTGDNEKTARAIAKQIGIENIISNVNPEQKLAKIKELNKNNNVAMVGDGINDSPSLKAAIVGISVENGTDISADSADVILLNENMNNIVKIFDLGKRTIRIIKENLFWALFYNVCMIPLATGLLPIALNPMIASLAMTLSSLTVVLNSLRLLKK